MRCEDRLLRVFHRRIRRLFRTHTVRHDKRRFFPAQLIQIQRRKLLGKLLLLRNLCLRRMLGSHGQNVRPIGCFPACLLPLLLAAFLDKNVRPHRLFLRLFLPLLHRKRRLVHGKVKLRSLCAAAFHLLLNVVNVLLRHVVHNPLGRVRMLALRLVIFDSGAVLDRGNDPADRHIKARNKLECQRRQQHNHRADAADDELERLRQKPGHNARAAAVQTALPELGEHVNRPFRTFLPADQLHQRADGHGQQKTACYAQRDGSSVMQQQDQKPHHERKRQYVKSRADEPLEKPDQQRQ